ncbi:MAG: beta-phosphoglucomutase family hydrolase [Desulfobulbaceae bacterium]|nr:beta-phosphoglucomutase family hydrolase [Desulfobulbaceae bacterium]
MATRKLTINPELYDAVLFDLDGVVTKTADTHANAWKILFDEYLRTKSGNDHFLPFDLKDDYVQYVDGKPRYKGVQDFLASRNISLSRGTVDDSPEEETICGLGNRKNRIFSDLLKKEGVQLYESTLDLIRQLRKNGFKIAVVSSSKNCLPVIQAVDIESLFDTRVDGVVAEKLGIPGKPEPDMFLQAANDLGVAGARCVVVEDALSGVEAGVKGGFGMVIGVNRADQAKQLEEKGACPVVDDLAEIRVGVLLENLPHALQFYSRIIGKIGGREIVIFLDHDSILSQMNSPPDDSFYQGIEKVLSSLADQFTVIVASGKKPEEVKKQLNIDSIYYVDSYGTLILGPDGLLRECDEHQPGMERSKGQAFENILQKLNLVSQSICPIYFADNVQDNEVFEVVSLVGIGIALGSGMHVSNASFRVDSATEIGDFLLKLASNLAKGTSWGEIYLGFDPKDEGRRETLCALGNGYFVTRGAAPEARADGVHYPGTYLAGGYNRLKTNIAGRTIENEDLVNLPNWLCLNFRIDGEEWFQIKDVTVLFYRQYLNIKKGVLNRTIRFRDKKNRETIFFQRTFVHGKLMHRAALRTIITPLNWEGTIEICSALDGRVTNLGVSRYRDLGNAHLDVVETKHLDEKSMVLKVRTNTSCLDIAMGARTELFINNRSDVAESVMADDPGGYVAKHFVAHVSRGDSLAIEKLICVYTSQDTGIFECLSEVEDTVINDVVSYDDLLKSHELAWELLWSKFEVRLELTNKDIEQYTQKTIRLYIFHLLQSSSVHSLDIDVGMPARGWHGEGYRGHIFWDEMIIFPFLNYRSPRITRTLLMYRYRRLKEAKRAARASGYKGAMYPWQSGSNGREETQQMHLNPESGRWLPDNTYLQRHVNNAIVYNISQYFQITNDIEFLSFYGGEIILEIARFWASLASYNAEIDRYEILGVMGPDEYHDAYPGAEQPGLNNNAYTNLMVMFVMDQALNVQNVIPDHDWESLRKKLQIEDSELEIWIKMSRRMKIVFHEGTIISQFEGYGTLKEFDWQGYKEKYGNIQRIDRILEKEGDSANNYKLCKQPDVLMIFYLFSAETLRKMFKRLDYTFDKDLILKNINYYLHRTTNGSSLALTIHAWIEARLARERSWELFSQALETDMVDERTGSTREGIHLAAMSGCIDILQRGYAGLEIRSDILILNPLLPKFINRISFHIRYRKHWLDLEITQHYVKVQSLTSKAVPFTIMIKEEIIRLYPGKKAVVDL